MTKEELIDFIKSTKGHWTFKTENGKEVSEEQIIKVLEQQTCEDCVSRAEVLGFLKGIEILHNHDELRTNLIYGIKQLPSVTPSIPDVENDFNLGYNCGYADAMSDIAESEE